MGRSTTAPAWRSGAALAAGGAVAAVGTHLSLRATSAGAPPSPLLLIGATVLLALALWPLAARTTRVSSLAAVLILAQIGTHLAVLMRSGRPVSASPSSLFCSPPCQGDSGGLLARLTAQGGWGLFAVQVLACVLLAAAVHGARRSLDVAAAALALLRAALRPLRTRLFALLSLMVRQIVVPAAYVGPRPVRVVPAAPTGLLLVRRRPRRGPPVLCARTAVPHSA